MVPLVADGDVIGCMNISRVGGEEDPIWAYGSWSALERAVAAEPLASPDAAFGLPSFDRHGGFAVAATGAGARARADALVKAGCRLLSGPTAFAEPLDAAAQRLLRSLKAELDPDDLFNPGTLRG